jgi:uncharacterized protein (TIRG00374 family)
MEVLKKILSVLLRIVLSILLLVFLFKQVDERSLLEVIKNVNKPLLLLAFIIYSLVYVLGLLRWYKLIKAVNIRIPLGRLVSSFCGGAFFSLFLPSTIGGDFLRSADLSIYTNKPKQIIATVFLDRLSGFIGLAILSLVAVFLGWKVIEDKSVLLSIWLIVGILGGLLFFLFNESIYKKINNLLKSPNSGKIRTLISDLHEEVHLFRTKKRTSFHSVLISVLIQSVPCLSAYVIALSLGINISPVYFFIFIPIIGAITLLPVSIGGLGLRDATMIFFFAKVGVSKDLAFAMSLLNFSFILFYGALGGLIYVYSVHNRRLQRNQPSRIQKAAS